jgi:hypothetical protein
MAKRPEGLPIDVNRASVPDLTRGPDINLN